VRITAIETSVVALPFSMGGPYTRFAGRLWDRLEILLVKVETEDGLVGWGEAFGHAAIPSTKAALDTILAPLMIGRDARDINGIARSVLHNTHLLGRNGAFVFGYSGIDIALWDLGGKRAGVPVFRLLGGAANSELEAYASLLNYTDVKLVEKNVTDACKAGYRYIKLHEVTREAALAAIHASKAGCTRIMLDVNCAWLPPKAQELAASLAGEGLLWLEEPVWPPEDIHGLAMVRQCGIPITAGENVAGVFGFETLIDAGAIDIAQPSVTKVGGISEMVKVIHLCRASGIKVYPHCPYFGPGLIASCHIAAALIEEPLIEVLWLDMEANPFDPWVRTRDGKIRVADGPGLGVEPDPGCLARYAKDKPVRITEGAGA
jgi:L-alanine-DL-glutamate epimerase-like enolase superfamily enzyme